MEVAIATVNAMVTGFGSSMWDVTVVIGPSVGACCFTLRRMEKSSPHCLGQGLLSSPPVFLNLHVLHSRILLQRGGVLPEGIHDDTVNDRPSVTLCTSSHPEAFFSRVRDGLNFGTQVGFLWMH
ncbi:unnamed protein product [Oncorhynchus mykiss]|uniref:Uncharacterized protein n=1 Tax=Oncorhynchus mykiss TaxID=8022 RepID=A0A060YDM6_ONCMY|nr:unnamed protein product [Oncorhynchus mykiss]